MTEQEAKTKWCPMVRLMTRIAPCDTDAPDQYMMTGNRFAGDFYDNGFDENLDHAVKCIGSACMMWRWQDEHAKGPSGSCGLAGPLNT